MLMSSLGFEHEKIDNLDLDLDPVNASMFTLIHLH